MAPRAEQSRAAAKRRAILHAATDLLYSEGLRGVTHRNVAARADVPVGSIGYYYSNRERLLATCFEDIARQRRELIDATLHPSPAPSDPYELAELVVRVIAGGDIDNVAGLVTATVDAQHESDELMQGIDEHWSGATEAVQAVLDAAEFTALTGEQVVRSVVGAVVCSLLDDDVSRAVVSQTEEILRKP